VSPADHFLSKLTALARSPGTGPGSFSGDGAELSGWIGREFCGLTAPLIGKAAAEDLCRRTLERLRGQNPESLLKLGYMAAFFLGEYEESSMPLEAEDWREVKETVEDASEVIDIDILTGLMDSLLSRGLLQ
jgi:hypothetical protein